MIPYQIARPLSCVGLYADDEGDLHVNIAAVREELASPAGLRLGDVLDALGDELEWSAAPLAFGPEAPDARPVRRNVKEVTYGDDD